MGGRTYYSAALPQFILYGDGLVVFGPPAAYSYEMHQARISEPGIQNVLEQLDELGLFTRDITLTDSNIADAPSSYFHLAVGGYDRLHNVYPAGAFGDTFEGRALRKGYAALDLGALPPTTIVEPAQPLEYSRVSVRVRRVAGPCEDAPVWPLAPLPTLELGANTCLDLERESARPILPVEPGFDNLISMRAGELCMQVTYRPVLPHEAACAEGEPSGCRF